MPTELPFVNETVSKVLEPIRKPETEIFIQTGGTSSPKTPISNEGGNGGSIPQDKFPVTQKPDDAIPLKKKGKPRGLNKDPEKMKEHMAKMRAKSAETRAKNKVSKSIPKQELQSIPEVPSTPNVAPSSTPNIVQPQYSQPVDANKLTERLTELEKQNKAYKDWYTQNKQHLDNIPTGGTSSPIVPIAPISNQGGYGGSIPQGLDRLHSLEQMIRKDEREKLMKQQKEQREEQAKNLSNRRHNMPVGLQKWKNMNASKHYANNEDMWADCFNPK